MSKEIAENKIPIIMKNGLVHWVTKATGERLQHALQMQQAHTFTRVSELGVTINTAEIEGVYTVTQYEDLCRLKQGMWHCEQGKWHAKKESCDCKREIFRKSQEEARRRQMQEDNKPLSDEDRKRAAKKLDEMRKDFEKRGIFPKKVGVIINNKAKK